MPVCLSLWGEKRSSGVSVHLAILLSLSLSLLPPSDNSIPEMFRLSPVKVYVRTTESPCFPSRHDSSLLSSFLPLSRSRTELVFNLKEAREKALSRGILTVTTATVTIRVGDHPCRDSSHADVGRLHALECSRAANNRLTDEKSCGPARAIAVAR